VIGIGGHQSHYKNYIPDLASLINTGRKAVFENLSATMNYE